MGHLCGTCGFCRLLMSKYFKLELYVDFRSVISAFSYLYEPIILMFYSRYLKDKRLYLFHVEVILLPLTGYREIHVAEI